jgi:hypothetical protein
VIADRSRCHVALLGDDAGRSDANELTEQVELDGRHAGTLRVAQHGDELDERVAGPVGRRRRREVIGRHHLFGRGAGPQWSAEGLEHGVGDQRRSDVVSSPVDVVRADRQPGGGDDLSDRVGSILERAVALGVDDQRRQEVLEHDPPGEFVGV